MGMPHDHEQTSQHYEIYGAIGALIGELALPAVVVVILFLIIV